ncbi:MAG: response regulator [Bacteroidetes bacterium]|nr:response regulator [Bacteroidota bacterium]
MKISKLYFFLILFPLFFNSSYAQDEQVTFEHLSIKDGLSQSTVYSILQDEQGFMWFGTQDRGLNKYDGYSFDIFLHDPLDINSISKNSISKIIQDHLGFIWIGTWGGGLDKLNPINNKITHYKTNPKNSSSLSNNRAQIIFEDSNNTLWIGTAGGGLNKYNREADNFSSYKHDVRDINSISNDRIWSISEDSLGYLWIATSNGLNRFDKKTKKFKIFIHDSNNNQSISHKQIRTTFIDKFGNLWLGTAVGLDLFNPKTETFSHHYLFSNNNEVNSVNKIFEDHNRNLWVGTHIGGLLKFDKEKKSFIRYINDPNDKNSIGYNDVRDIYEDNAQNLWIATRGGGLNKINLKPQKFTHFGHKLNDDNSLGNNRVRTIYEDKNGLIWIGTDVGGGLDTYDRKKKKFTHYYCNPKNKNSLSCNDISVIYQDRKGIMWIGTDGEGLNSYDTKKNLFTHYKNSSKLLSSIVNNKIRSIYEDKYKNLWIGTVNGLDKFDKKNNRFIHYKHNSLNDESISNNFIWTIFQDSFGNLWVGTNNGLNLFNYESETFSKYFNITNNDKTISSNEIFSISETRTGTLLVGTGRGIDVYDRENDFFSLFTKNKEVVSSAIYGIIEDDSWNLWLSTVNNLILLNSKNKKIKSFNIYDGLQNNDFSIGASVKSKNGDLIFGGINGINIFNPDSIKYNKHLPNVIITDFLIFNKPVKIGQNSPLNKKTNYTKVINLNYKQNFFSFKFSALDFTNHQENKYQYKLENFDEDWNYAGSRNFANYTNIPHGTYIFKVKGSNDDELWNETPSSVKIIISPPFWKTLIFKTLIFIVSFLIIVSFLKIREKNSKKERKILAQKIKIRTSKIINQNAELERAYEKVKQSVKSKEMFLANTSHEIRTPLNVIIGFTNLLQKTPLSKKQFSYLNDIKSSSDNLLMIINDILDFSKIEAGKLKIEYINFNFRDVFNNFLNTVSLKSYENGVKLNSNIDDDVPLYFLGDPFRLNQILLNLVDNAIKFTPAKGYINISVSTLEERENEIMLLFKISDTGIGISQKQLSLIFESFTQGENHTTRIFSGTGLGLSIVKRLVEVQGGHLSVISEEGKGSTFSFTILYKKGENSKIKYKESKSKIKKNINYSGNILLVEDNPINVTIVVDTLKFYNKNLNIDVAVNGKDGVDKIKENDYNIVIMDIQMPVMDGYEATKLIRNLDNNKCKIPILGMSAHAMTSERKKCLSLGMNDYITKPFDPNELFEKIKNLIGPTQFTKVNVKKQVPLMTEKKAKLINLDLLNKVYNGNGAKIKKILKLSLDNIPIQIKDLSKNYESNNFKGLRINAHSLKTTLNYLGLSDISNTSKNIEKLAATNSNLSQVPDMIKEIENVWKNAKEELIIYIDEN